jgi:hypothetical protein
VPHTVALRPSRRARGSTGLPPGVLHGARSLLLGRRVAPAVRAGRLRVAASPREAPSPDQAMPCLRSVRFQSANPRDLALKTGDRQPPRSTTKALICREIRPIGIAAGSACHAEGRGFESLQPLSKDLHLQVFFLCAVGWCVCVAGYPVGTRRAIRRRSVPEQSVCRQFLMTRSIDLLFMVCLRRGTSYVRVVA